MTEPDIDRKLLEGLRENMAELRRKENALYKAKGLREHIANIDVAVAEKREKESDIKKEVSALAEKKNEAVAKLADKMTASMKAILEPVGTPVIEISDSGGLFLGVEKPDGKRVHGQALSGGERVIFDAALSYAMTRGGESDAVIVVEAAEADADRLRSVLKTLIEANPDAQFIVNSWDGSAGRDLAHDENVDFVNLAEVDNKPDDLFVKPIEDGGK